MLIRTTQAPANPSQAEQLLASPWAEEEAGGRLDGQSHLVLVNLPEEGGAKHKLVSQYTTHCTKHSKQYPKPTISFSISYGQDT